MAESDQNTDEAVVEQAKKQISTPDVENVNEGKTEEAQVEPQAEEEKLLAQSEVNKIVGGVKIEAYERGKREVMAEIEAQKAKKTLDGKEVTIPVDQLEKIVADHSLKLAQKQRAEEVAGQFVNKMQLGMQKYNDFESVVGSLDIPNLPGQFIEFANSVDNTADLMYEFGNNPSKFASIYTLSLSNPSLAYKEMAKLSDSIKRNKEAAEKQAKAKVNEPLDQVKPSIAGTDDGKLDSIAAYRKQSWLRG